MRGTELPPPAPLLITSDEGLRDEALTAVAAAGTEAMIAPDLRAALPAWAGASMVLVGIDQASDVCDRRPPTDHPLHLLGDQHDREELCRLSALLGAAVVVLPDQRAFLADAIRGLVGPGRGVLLAVIGASGGLGASTLAAGMAWRAHDRSTSTLLADLDPYGGGLDLVLGIESEPGWRWDQLAEVSGGVSDLAERLPCCEGLPVLSGGRDRPVRTPGAAAVTDVVGSARADHALVVADLGHRGGEVASIVAHDADAALVLVRDDVRGVAAAAGLLDADPGVAWQVLVRRGPGSDGLPEDAIAEVLARPVAGTLPYDRSLRTAALQGVPPGPGAGRAWRRQLDRLLDLTVSS